MKDMQRGFRGKMEDFFNLSKELTVSIAINGNSDYDSCCFGVDSSDKLSDDRYVVFYNQTMSPNREIVLKGSGANTSYGINLLKLPNYINKLVFTASIDGAGTMGQVQNFNVVLSQGSNMLKLNMNGSEFRDQKAIISIEIYKKDVWRVAAVAGGFNGGLSALLKHYGGEEIVAPQPVVTQHVVPSIQIPIPQKKVPEKKVPEKISLKKGEKISLSKTDDAPIIVENGWTAKGKDYDLKALVRYRNGKLVYIGAANQDESLQTPDGAVKHGGDVKNPGELEHILVKWHKDIASVAVSSYSALENGPGSFNRYGVYVRVRNGNQIVEIPAANTSANDHSYTLCFGEIIFGDTKNSLDVINLEMYSRPSSESRIGYKGEKVVMDIGPSGRLKL